jgi:hypothetical protein
MSRSGQQGLLLQLKALMLRAPMLVLTNRHQHRRP